jgi:hypothetical protein
VEAGPSILRIGEVYGTAPRWVVWKRALTGAYSNSSRTVGVLPPKCQTSHHEHHSRTVGYLEDTVQGQRSVNLNALAHQIRAEEVAWPHGVFDYLAVTIPLAIFRLPTNLLLMWPAYCQYMTGHGSCSSRSSSVSCRSRVAEGIINHRSGADTLDRNQAEYG